jgi:hypothetical protein
VTANADQPQTDFECGDLNKSDDGAAIESEQGWTGAKYKYQQTDQTDSQTNSDSPDWFNLPGDGGWVRYRLHF